MIHNQNKQNISERVELKGILSEFRDALEQEINEIEKNGQSSILLFGGRQIESHSIDLWYRFNIEYTPSIPADTPCKLIIGKDQFDVTVISFDENSIVISTKTSLPDTIVKARLENGATILMERLIKCIEENAAKENPVGIRMLPANGEIYTSKKIFNYTDLTLSSVNTLSQNKAIIAALSNDITYIWGPPGTGKTTVIGQIINELYKHNRSVLVVSHTNTAVDGAIEKVDEAYSSTHLDNDMNYPILRIGIPTKPLPDRVLLSQHVAILGKELYKQKSSLEKQQSEIQQRVNKILPLLAKNNWLKESNLENIRKALQSITVYENRIEDLQKRIEEINASISQEKANHPKCASYLSLLKTLQAKKDNYNSICNRFQNTEATISVLHERIQAAQDEVRKHDKYAELRTQESKYMSVHFLRNEIDKTNTQIESLQNTINDLISKQADAQQTIAAYEKKSSIAKFLSGKSTVTQAKAIFDRIQVDLPDTKQRLQRQQNLKQEYSQQLENLLFLHEQILAVTPSKTQEFWINEVRYLKTELSTVQDSLSVLSTQKTLLSEKLYKLELEQEYVKPAFDRINELEKKLLQEHDNLVSTTEKRKQLKDSCSDLLKRELSLCVSFVCMTTFEGDSSLFEKLSKLFVAVKAEMATIDIVVIQKEKEDKEQQLTKIFCQLNDINQKMQELEKQAIMSAKIVGATLAKSYLSDTLRKRIFDTVILDEASMASIPALWCASYLATNSIVIVGDFLQLPPIVMANTPLAQKWLGMDIFYHSRMKELARDKETCPDNFVMLNNQFRMESDIADIANMYYGAYGGLLSDDQNEFRIKDREKFYGWYSGKRNNQNVILIDTESLHAWVTGVPQGKNHSRLNCFSAVVTVELAFKALENKLKNLDPVTAEPVKGASVLIVAPYKPHAARVNQLIDLEYRNRGFKENLNYIRAGTIHSFQGSEADIVIFDLVIDEPHWKANLFMKDKEVNDNLRKMFNVAVTRAKFKLFIVGNFSYCQRLAKNNALSELLDKLIRKDQLSKIDAKTLFPQISFTHQSELNYNGNLVGKHIVCRENSFNDYFMTDINSFEKRLIIYSAFMTEARLSTLLPAFSDAIRSGKQIIIVTKALSDRGKSELRQYQKCEKELRDIGVHIIHKKGMHEKLIFIDSNAIWIGSLNALSFTGLTGEVMQRYADHEFTVEYEKLFDIEYICKAIKNEYEQKCPICRSEMIIKESDKGGIYWQCVANDYSRNVTQQYPLDGILRCNKCGAPYVFAMKNEPRWVCSENKTHYQKMRESDLNLKNMANLIPSKEVRKKVDEFFAQKRKIREETHNNRMATAAVSSQNNSTYTNKAEQLKMF